MSAMEDLEKRLRREEANDKKGAKRRKTDRKVEERSEEGITWCVRVHVSTCNCDYVCTYV